MNTQLLEIEPKELEFKFILKKQCSCSVRITNNTDQHVAFKVKTTSPKKYCVRPNVGIIMPNSICDFTVTMQAQLEAPPDMICGDKFLIQSTVVPFGTIDADITSATFAKDSGRYIEEHKLKVALVIPPQLSVSSPINGTRNQGTDHNASIQKEPEFSKVTKVEGSKMINLEDLNPTKDVEWKPKKDMFYAEDLRPEKDAELKPKTVVNDEDVKLKPVKDVDSKARETILDTEELKPVEEVKFAKDSEEMKSKLANLEYKLGEAEATISKLTEDRRLSTQERKILENELVLLRKKAKLNEVKVGFPVLFVCMVALISVYIGYFLAPLIKNSTSRSDLYQQ